MPTIDLDQYYAEREARMNIPDETVDEHMKRMAPSKRSNNAYASSSRIPNASFLSNSSRNVTTDLTSAPAAASHVSDGLKFTDTPADCGRTKKRKASDTDSQLEPAGPKQKKTVVNQDASREVSQSPRIDHPTSRQEHFLIGKQFDDALRAQDKSSPSLEDIESFTFDMCDRQVLPKVKPIKPKTLLKEIRQNPRKKRRLVLPRSPQVPVSAAELSPILSFSRAIETFEKRQNFQEEISTMSETPQLDLRPFEVPLGKPSKIKVKISKSASGPRISPIEDPSAVFYRPPIRECVKPLGPESSEMYLEVKKRIAKHAATNQRDKILKLGSKLVLRQPGTSKAAAEVIEDSSIIYVSSSPSSRASSPALAEPVIAKQKEKPKKPVTEKKKTIGKKVKPPQVTPTDYARMLQAKAATAALDMQETSTSRPVPKKNRVKFLQGRNIFYIGGDIRQASATTRGRMDIIVRFGGNLMPEYDPAVTSHIITDAPIFPTVRALGLKRLKYIPNHISTVKWSWVSTLIGQESFLSQEEIDDKLSNVWMHAAFSERMDAGYYPPIPKSAPSFRAKGKEKAYNHPHDIRGDITSVSSTASAIQQSRASSSNDGMSFRPPQLIHHRGALLLPPKSPLRPLESSVLTPQAAKTEKVILTTVGKEQTDRDAEDPLAEFYDQALAQQNKEDGWSSLGELDMEESDGRDTDDEPAEAVHVPRQKRGWTCDNKESQRTTSCPNQDIVDKLTELMNLHKSKLGDEDHWRAFSYSKSIRALRNHPRRIKSFEEARSVRGVGEKTARKIEEILQTGELRRITYEKTNDVEVTRLFQGVYGVGQSIAFKWYQAGCRTLQDLKDSKCGVKLSAVQEIGLRYYDDINDRMPRAEAKEIFELIKPIALAIDSQLFIEIMGSYRRGKADCGDIDIIITRPTNDGLTHQGVLPRLLRELHAAGIITEDLAVPEDPDDLEAIYRGLCRLPDINGSRRRRIDFLSVPWISRGAALLYYTGDDIFNRAIRLKANVLGYSLNQKGLFGNVVRDPRDRRIKMNAGVLVASETEEEIFKILGVPWQEPHERVRG